MLLTGLLAAHSTQAQYVFDPSAADELDKPGVHFFGVAKDEAGRPVPDVLVVIEDIDTSYTLVTGAAGRYRARLPVGTTLRSVTATCSKPGRLSRSMAAVSMPRTGLARPARFSAPVLWFACPKPDPAGTPVDLKSRGP